MATDRPAARLMPQKLVIHKKTDATTKIKHAGEHARCLTFEYKYK